MVLVSTAGPGRAVRPLLMLMLMRGVGVGSGWWGKRGWGECGAGGTLLGPEGADAGARRSGGVDAPGARARAWGTAGVTAPVLGSWGGRFRRVLAGVGIGWGAGCWLRTAQ